MQQDRRRPAILNRAVERHDGRLQRRDSLDLQGPCVGPQLHDYRLFSGRVPVLSVWCSSSAAGPSPCSLRGGCLRRAIPAWSARARRSTAIRLSTERWCQRAGRLDCRIHPRSRDKARCRDRRAEVNRSRAPRGADQALLRVGSGRGGNRSARCRGRSSPWAAVAPSTAAGPHVRRGAAHLDSGCTAPSPAASPSATYEEVEPPKNLWSRIVVPAPRVKTPAAVTRRLPPSRSARV